MYGSGMDNVIVTFAQACEVFRLSPGTLRRWIAEGRVQPVLREGRGRGGAMHFRRGEISAEVFGACPVCGNGFRRARAGQQFCGRACRDRARG